MGVDDLKLLVDQILRELLAEPLRAARGQQVDLLAGCLTNDAIGRVENEIDEEIVEEILLQ